MKRPALASSPNSLLSIFSPEKWSVRRNGSVGRLQSGGKMASKQAMKRSRIGDALASEPIDLLDSSSDDDSEVADVPLQKKSSLSAPAAALAVNRKKRLKVRMHTAKRKRSESSSSSDFSSSSDDDDVTRSAAPERVN